MRKAIICILLVLYVINQLGTILYYEFQPIIHTACYYQWKGARKNSRQEHIFVLDSTEYLAAKVEDEEIFLQGTLYDIQSMQAKGSKFIIYADEDIAESKWMNAFNDLRTQIKKNQSSQAPISLNIIKWLFKLYSPGTQPGIQNIEKLIKNKLHLHRESNLRCLYRIPPIHPPDFIA